MKRLFTVLAISILALLLNASFTGCPQKPAKNGTVDDNTAPVAEQTGQLPWPDGAQAPDDPVRVAFVPSVEAGTIETQLGEFEKQLSELIGHPVEADVVLSYSACIEQMGAGHFDLAMLPPFAYVLAHERYNFRVALKVVRDGKATYRGEIITRTDSGINTLEDLRDRTFAFTEATSASGHLYPKTFLITMGIDPDKDFADAVFKGDHSAVVQSVFQGQVDAGACYDDARERLLETEPTIMEQTKIIAYTPDIPGDTVSFRAELIDPFWEVVSDAMIEISHKGQDGVLYKIYEIDELVPAQDSDYDPIRQMVETLDFDLSSAVN